MGDIGFLLIVGLMAFVVFSVFYFFHKVTMREIDNERLRLEVRKLELEKAAKEKWADK